MAERLGQLVLSGEKTATSSALWEYEHNDEPLPRLGDLSILLGGRGKPLCLIETSDVQIHPFEDVPASFAYEEGEGDRSVAAWQAAHWAFFSDFLPRLGLEPTRDMPVVCERFRVVARA